MESSAVQIVSWIARGLVAAIFLVMFLIVVFPANAHLAAHPERFGRASIPFWPRLIAQLVLIAIVLVAGLLR